MNYPMILETILGCGADVIMNRTIEQMFILIFN
jgi:hypothetical protein